ncbi:hypothetical protein FOMG_09894 [Fusarium oxysporum f. sp. melonis 26406]|uniref:Uncharacterized protein n=1 Tax=Fusarium oxysporum f. sp. melonis 26406 TaxID=1089452 RepID=X0AUI3_FUSOX|nr:hypothetical protein FOMG_09894 [Fusarium oxysporum f. sp. melonis 26406]
MSIEDQFQPVRATGKGSLDPSKKGRQKEAILSRYQEIRGTGRLGTVAKYVM